MKTEVRSQHKENSKAWWNERYTLSSADFLYGKAPSTFLSQYAELFPKNAKILDLACGEGRNAVALAKMGFQVVAIDYSETALERAKKLAIESGVEIQFKSNDLELFLPELMTYDAILAVDYKPAKTLLSNVSRGLKQNGILLIENYLMESAKAYEGVEAFECFQPNELLKLVIMQSSFKVLNYSELGPGKWGEKVYLIAQKTQLL